MRKILITTQKLICRRPPWCCSHLKAITAVYKVPVIHDLLLDHEGRKPDGRRGNEGSCFTWITDVATKEAVLLVNYRRGNEGSYFTCAYQ